jgi:RNA polymerase sigma factor (sigma-70 family)
VLAYLARRVTPREEAADVGQLTLTTVWRKIDKVPRADDEALPWLFAVARGELANHRRGQPRRLAATDRLRAELAAGVPAGGEPAAYAPGSGATTEAERVHDALAALDATDREIVTLTYWDGLTADQVGRVVGLRGAAVRKRLQQARERMASTLTLPGRSETEGTLREGSQARGESVPAH